MKIKFLLIMLLFNSFDFYNTYAASSAASTSIGRDDVEENLKTEMHLLPFFSFSRIPKVVPEMLPAYDSYILHSSEPSETLRPHAKLEITDAKYTTLTTDGRVRVVDTKPTKENILGIVEDGRDARMIIETQNEPDAVHGYIKVTYKNNSSYIGTGILVGPNQVLTAGHNIFSHEEDEGWPDSLTFTPARKIRSAPFGIARAKAFLSTRGWVNKKDAHYDIGMIILDVYIGKKTGWYGLLSAEDRILREFNVNITGYPDELGPEPYTGTVLCTSVGKAIAPVDEHYLYHNVDTSPGQSGSGVWLTYDDKYYVIGIHTYQDKINKRNIATKITKPIFDIIIGWLNETDIIAISNPLLEEGERKEKVTAQGLNLEGYAGGASASSGDGAGGSSIINNTASSTNWSIKTLNCHRCSLPTKNPSFIKRKDDKEIDYINIIRDEFHKDYDACPKARSIAIIGDSEKMIEASEIVIAGMGGVGKTQLALEYAHQAILHKAYDLVWWIYSESEELILKSYHDILRRLDVPLAGSENNDDIIQLVKNNVMDQKKCKRWLFIYDNAFSQDWLSKIIPQYNGHILITTRYKDKFDWIGRLIHLNLYRNEEAIQYLFSTADITEAAESDKEDALAVAKMLGNLPLALSHAAAYVREHKISFKEYLEHYQKKNHELLEYDKFLEACMDLYNELLDNFTYLRDDYKRLEGPLTIKPKEILEKTKAIINKVKASFSSDELDKMAASVGSFNIRQTSLKNKLHDINTKPSVYTTFQMAIDSIGNPLARKIMKWSSYLGSEPIPYWYFYKLTKDDTDSSESNVIKAINLLEKYSLVTISKIDKKPKAIRHLFTIHNLVQQVIQIKEEKTLVSTKDDLGPFYDFINDLITSWKSLPFIEMSWIKQVFTTLSSPIPLTAENAQLIYLTTTTFKSHIQALLSYINDKPSIGDKEERIKFNIVSILLIEALDQIAQHSIKVYSAEATLKSPSHASNSTYIDEAFEAAKISKEKKTFLNKEADTIIKIRHLSIKELTEVLKVLSTFSEEEVREAVKDIHSLPLDFFQNKMNLSLVIESLNKIKTNKEEILEVVKLFITENLSNYDVARLIGFLSSITEGEIKRVKELRGEEISREQLKSFNGCEILAFIDIVRCYEVKEVKDCLELLQPIFSKLNYATDKIIVLKTMLKISKDLRSTIINLSIPFIPSICNGYAFMEIIELVHGLYPSHEEKLKELGEVNIDVASVEKLEKIESTDISVQFARLIKILLRDKKLLLEKNKTIEKTHSTLLENLSSLPSIPSSLPPMRINKDKIISDYLKGKEDLDSSNMKSFEALAKILINEEMSDQETADILKLINDIDPQIRNHIIPLLTSSSYPILSETYSISPYIFCRTCSKYKVVKDHLELKQQRAKDSIKYPEEVEHSRPVNTTTTSIKADDKDLVRCGAGRPEDNLIKIEAVEDGLAAVTEASRKLGEETGAIGPRSIAGWQLEDVEDRGNCFYDAIVLQMQNLKHSFLETVPTGTLPRDSIRGRIQGHEFKDEEWAEDQQIDKFVKEFDVILAIADTRTPENGFICYYLDTDGSVFTHVPDNSSPLPDKPIIRLAATGNHFLSVKSHPALSKGCLQRALETMVLHNASLASQKVEKEEIDKAPTPHDAATDHTMVSMPSASIAPVNVDTSLAPTSLIPTPAAILGEEVRYGAGRPVDNLEKKAAKDDISTAVMQYENLSADFRKKRNNIFELSTYSDEQINKNEILLKKIWEEQVTHWHDLHKLYLAEYEKIDFSKTDKMDLLQLAIKPLCSIYVEDESSHENLKRALGVLLFIPDVFLSVRATMSAYMNDLSVWYSLAIAARYGDALAIQLMADYLNILSNAKSPKEPSVTLKRDRTLAQVITGLREKAREQFVSGKKSKYPYIKAYSNFHLGEEDQALEQLKAVIRTTSSEECKEMDPRVFDLYEYINFSKGPFDKIYASLESDPSSKYYQYCKFVKGLSKSIDHVWYCQPIGGYSKYLRTNHIREDELAFKTLQSSKEEYIDIVVSHLLELLGEE